MTDHSNRFTYHVDIALCIDCTGSMSSIIERVKTDALSFPGYIKDELTKAGKEVHQFRIRVIGFRDFGCDAEPIISSPFFKMPEQVDEFRAFVSRLHANGGGDAPESGLEAIHSAIRSEWTHDGTKRRHVVVMWTDTSAHPLGKDGKPDSYPKDMPVNFDDLTDLWRMSQDSIDQRGKRLIIFAPEVSPWNEIYTDWDQVTHAPTEAGGGLEEKDMRSIVDVIVKSVA